MVMNLRAQTSIEMLLILAVSVIAIGIIYSLYGQQVDVSNQSKEYVSAKSTLDKMVNAANYLYVSGAGSKSKILIDLPTSLDMNGAFISGKLVGLRLSNGNDIFVSSDVNFSGDWKKVNGEYILGGYYMVLYFDGRNVIISYDDFELSSDSIYASAKQGSVIQKFFSVRNNSQFQETFFLTSSFPTDNFSSLTISPDDIYFSLSPGESRIINFDIVLGNASSGNYAGTISVTGQVNDGVSDSNVTKTVLVSAESFLKIEPVMIFPKKTMIFTVADSLVKRSFSVCNSNNFDVSSISWSRASNPDANMLSWFNWPIVDTNGNAIDSISSGACINFDINFDVPADTPFAVYDSNISFTYGDGNISSAYIYVQVASDFYSFFMSVPSNTLPASLALSTGIKKNNNSYIATGELDWNTSANYTYNGIDYNRDLNGLVAYYKFEDKNSGGWMLNSATGFRDANLANGADVNAIGLWDSNAGFFDGTDDFVSVGNSSMLNMVNEITLEAWVNNINALPLGSVSNPAISCKQISDNGSSKGNAFYWIDTDGNGAAAAFQGYCDMNSNGGGWLLVNHSMIDSTYSQADTNNIVETVGDNNGVIFTHTATDTGCGGGHLDPRATVKITNTIPWDVVKSKQSLWGSGSCWGINGNSSSTGSNLLAFNVSFDTIQSCEHTCENPNFVIPPLSRCDNEAQNFFHYTYSECKTCWKSFELISRRVNRTSLSGPAYSASCNTIGGVAGQGVVWKLENVYIRENNSIPAGISKTGAYEMSFDNNSVGAGINGKNITAALPLGWNHVAFTYNKNDPANQQKLYVNGVLVAQGTLTEAITVNTNALIIGRYFRGSIDEMKIYNRALSGTEVALDYNRAALAKFVDGNIVVMQNVSDWNAARINSDLNFSFGNEISEGESFFDSNLIGLWHLNDKNSSGWLLNSATGLRDANFFGNANVNTSGLWGTNAASFDGDKDSVIIYHSKSMNSFTVSAWLFPMSAVNDENYGQTYFSSSFPYGTGTSYEIWLLIDSGNNVKVYAYQNAPATFFMTTSNLVKLNQWNHVVVTAVKSGALNVYVNGDFAGAGNSGTFPWDSNEFIIGDLRQNRGIDFNGMIEEVAIWDRVLNAQEISNLYLKGSSRIDLNVYSCSDANCINRTGSHYLTGVQSNVWTALNSNVRSSKYLGFDAFFNKAIGFTDYNAQSFWVGPYLRDFAVMFYG